MLSSKRLRAISPNADRRAMKRLLLAAVCTVVRAGLLAGRPAEAQTTDDATATIQRLDAALLAAMKAGQRTPFAQRFAALAPVIERTFDLEAVLAVSVGRGWSTLPSDQKPGLAATFRRYTVASYAASFDSYSGQSFQVSPTVRPIGNGDVVVSTTFSRTDGSTVRIDYVMRNGPGGWKAVDVLTGGGISRVAVQRADFGKLLTTGGAPALIAALQRKVTDLSGGALG
jgi:phospholipid transport system substrate-binding protein